MRNLNNSLSQRIQGMNVAKKRNEKEKKVNVCVTDHIPFLITRVLTSQ